MEYISILGFIVALIGFVFYRSYKNEQHKRELFLSKCKSLVGNPPQASLRINYVPSVANKKGHVGLHNTKNDSVPEGYIDDITWSNLDMDAVFDRMNYCMTKEGAAFLDEMLHNQKFCKDRLDFLDKAIELADNHIEMLQRYLADYRNTRIKRKEATKADDKNDEAKSKNSAIKELSLNLLYLLAVVIIGFAPALGVAALVAVCAYMIVNYFRKKSEVQYLIDLIEELANVCRTTAGLEKLDCYQNMSETYEAYENLETSSLHKAKNSLLFISKKSRWIGDTSANNGAVGTLLVYIKMLFHIDLISLYGLENRLKEAQEAVRIQGRFLGFVDSSLSLALWRRSLECWSKPVFESTLPEIVVEEAIHPLVDAAVSATISTNKKGILITGSNASGKSTFLKNIALQLLLAQTVNTVTAKAIHMPHCRIITAMGVSDDILKGDSYYMAEIKALKRIMSTDTKFHTICFIDEVLRGTNTIERIAASTAILDDLQNESTTVFCATHDIELTHLLEGQYDNYHFTEELVDGDISFSYELKKGRAESRNAIYLLKTMGYSEEIIEKAKKMAAEFDNTHEWIK